MNGRLDTPMAERAVREPAAAASALAADHDASSAGRRRSRRVASGASTRTHCGGVGRHWEH